jgi:hypothetical protein
VKTWKDKVDGWEGEGTYHDVDTGAAEVLQGDELQLVDTADRVGHGLDTHKGQHLIIIGKEGEGG